MWHTFRLFTILRAGDRARYYKEQKIFHSMGEHCSIMDRKVPLYAKLISLGNNVHLASGVHFTTHDITHSMLNNVDEFLLKRGEKSNTLKKLDALKSAIMFLLVLEHGFSIMSE